MDMAFSPDQVRVVDFPATRIMAMSHRGDPARLPETIGRFVAWRKASRLPPKTCPTFNILYGDPAEAPSAGFRLDLCVATDRRFPDAAVHGLEEAVLPAGRCAVLRHVGSDDGLGAAFDFLCRQWLPASGETPRAAPLFLQRVAFFPEVPETEAVLDIFLPLA
jgi:AraC family transcriptional regulator